MKRLALPAALAMLLAGSAQAQTLTERQSHGKALFDGTCGYCHGARGHATVLLRRRLGEASAVIAERNNLTPAYIKVAVRHGVMSMPWYRRSELSDDDLAAITDYLTRSNPGRGSAAR
ncbi:MAG: cytochrome c [Caulobacteraceae bacterium]